MEILSEEDFSDHMSALNHIEDVEESVLEEEGGGHDPEACDHEVEEKK